MQQSKSCLMFAIVLGVMALWGGTPGIAASTPSPITDRLSWQIGLAVPNGTNVSEQYGSTWVDLGVNYQLKDDAKSTQFLTLGVMAGSKDRTFYDYHNYSNDTVTSFGRIVPVKYTYEMKTKSPLYFGGGAGLYVVNSEARYDAGDGYVWASNDNRYFSVSTTKFTVAPHLLVGYKVNEKLGIELGYTMISSKLAGNASGYNNLPDVPEAKLSSVLTLSGTFKF